MADIADIKELQAENDQLRKRLDGCLAALQRLGKNKTNAVRIRITKKQGIVWLKETYMPLNIHDPELGEMLLAEHLQAGDKSTIQELVWSPKGGWVLVTSEKIKKSLKSNSFTGND